MQFRSLGHSGLRVSAVGLGCNNFGARIDTDAAQSVVDAAIDLGINLFDTSDSYGGRGGSEMALGEALGAQRKDIVLATKFGSPMDDAGRLMGASRRYVMQAVEASLKRLRTDWIDLYQLHRPDPHTPLDETLRAIDDLVRQGKVRYFGLSNHPAWQALDAVWIAATKNLSPPVSCQDEFSLLMRAHERELIPMLKAKGLALLPYFPLAGGLLTGKYRRGEQTPAGARLSSGGSRNRFMTEENWRKLDALRDFAQPRGRSLLELSFAWLLANPAVSSVIAGATSREQLSANVKAAEWTLSPQDLSELDHALGR